MAASREGVGRFFTRSGRECAAFYLFDSWNEADEAGNLRGTLRGADPDIALETFKPGEVATLELGSGERLQVDITAVLPGDEIAFTVRDKSPGR